MNDFRDKVVDFLQAVEAHIKTLDKDLRIERLESSLRIQLIDLKKSFRKSIKDPELRSVTKFVLESSCIELGVAYRRKRYYVTINCNSNRDIEERRNIARELDLICGAGVEAHNSPSYLSLTLYKRIHKDPDEVAIAQVVVDEIYRFRRMACDVAKRIIEWHFTTSA
jgi:hypothetical protein